MSRARRAVALELQRATSDPMELRGRPRATVLVAAMVALVVAGLSVKARGAVPATLPSVTPDQLVASMAAALLNPGPMAGDLRTHVDLGLPSLPAQAGEPDDPTARAIAALNGDHGVRLWRSNAGLRLAELLPAAELGLFVRYSKRSAEAWAWDSATFTAFHIGPLPVSGPDPVHPLELVDPAILAGRSLAAIAPSTRVVLGSPLQVAGRDAYRLVLEPRSTGTLVGRIEIAIDAARRIPLSVGVFARRARTAALSVTFARISFAPVDPQVFRFAPPPGATVVPLRSPAGKDLPPPRRYGATPGLLAAPAVRVFGDGWETVLAYRIPSLDRPSGDRSLDVGSLLPLSGALFSIRLAERPGHDWLMFGAVPQARLAVLERALP
jgi:hypothetical protein